MSAGHTDDPAVTGRGAAPGVGGGVTGPGGSATGADAADASTVSGSGSGRSVADTVASHIVDVPDFPQPGVIFKDLTPLFADGDAFRTVIDAIIEHHGADSFDQVVGIEARGFVIAAAVAYAVGAGVVPVRKAGKLPRETVNASYQLEYGEAQIELHADAFAPGERVLVVDDVLATGGTAEAALRLVESAGGTVTGFSVVIELSFLNGRDRLSERPVHALLTV
ncbi:MAG: adenine phosphoribosyltransferase [Micromonosporaceae bacterium]